MLPSGALSSPSLVDFPTLAPEYLADEPLELLAVESSQVAGPLEQMTSVGRLGLDPQPYQDHQASPCGRGEVHRHEPEHRPLHDQGQCESQAPIQEDGDCRDASAGCAFGDAEEQPFESAI